MKLTSRGFTLVELMIVVAIIGILAAVAIPAYSDYTARAQVSEGVQLASSYRTGMAEYYQNTSVWPSNLTAIGSTTSGKYIDSMVITTGAGATGDLVITSTFKASGVSPFITGSTFAISTSDGGNTWDCGQLGTAAANTNLEAKHLPSACK